MAIGICKTASLIDVMLTRPMENLREDGYKKKWDARAMAVGETSVVYYSGDVECDGVVELVEKTACGLYCVVVNRTVCYPQGGGQPSDVGEMYNDVGTFKIVKARREGGCVEHIGEFSGDVFSVGDEVHIKVDSEKRMEHSRLHSAGHLIDAVVHELGYRLRGWKGYHFPDSPYVEYKGEVCGDVVEIGQRISEVAKELIDRDAEVCVWMDVSREEAIRMCGELDPMYLDMPRLRIVKIGGLSSPCGGTHVRRLGELGGVRVSKIKVMSGKQMVRVYYRVEG